MNAAEPSATAANIRRARTLRGVPPEHAVVPHGSIAELLDLRAALAPEKNFLTYYNDDTGERTALTFGEFNARVNRTANYLQGELGVKRGDTLGILAHNHPDAILVSFACWKLGAVLAPQNVGEDDSRIAFIVENACCRVLLVMPDYAERARALALTVECLEKLVVVDESYQIALARQATQFSPPADDMREDQALLVYTSGTTGAPKGVMLSQHNLLVDCDAVVRWLSVTADTRLMCVLPVHHVNGLLITHLVPLLAGASTVLNRGFKAGMFWRRMAQERVHIVSVVPTILQFLCEADADISSLDLSRFRQVVCGAGTLPVALATRFEERFRKTILHGYGLSETTAFASMTPLDLNTEQHRHWLTHYGYPSIGCAIGVNEMAIHDAEGRALSPGQKGEIVMRGPNVMLGYFKRDDANLETFKHGWFRSGDEGFFELDEQERAHYFITGRLKELINRGGVKYSPFEIEEVLLAIPGVKVGLAVAFDNDWYGEEVGAYIVKETGANLSEEQVIHVCRERMPFSKSPKAVKFGAEIPVTTTGKWQRLKLKELFSEYRQTQFREDQH
jgi:long-chain acyl-CoA synthetase